MNISENLKVMAEIAIQDIIEGQFTAQCIINTAIDCIVNELQEQKACREANDFERNGYAAESFNPEAVPLMLVPCKCGLLAIYGN